MPTQDEVFESRLRSLLSFTQTHERAPSRSSDDTTERALGDWFARTKSRYQRGLLRGLQHELFERRVPEDLLRTDHKWYATLAKLSEFQHERGHFPNRDSSDSSERRLSSWLGHQRNAFRGEAMPKQKIDALDAAVPGWDSGHDDLWTAQLLEFTRYLTANNGSLPPSATSLGQWLYRQRSRLRDGTLRPDRLLRLDAASVRWEGEAADMDSASEAGSIGDRTAAS